MRPQSLAGRASRLILSGCLILAAPACGGSDSELPEEPQVFVVDPDGEGRRQITRGPGHWQLSWSPDGRRIAAAREGAVEVVDVEGDRATRIEAGSTVELAWSPAGDAIALLEMREERSFTLRTVRSDGSQLSRIAGYQSSRLASPELSWSPDGNRLAYVRPPRRAPPVTVRPPPTGARGPQPPVADTSELKTFVAKSDGSTERRLTMTSGDELDPRWSPDGRSILFLRQLGLDEYALYVAAARGGSARRVAGDLVAARPSWSPDGRTIAFTGVTTDGDRRYHLYLVPSTGGRPREMTGEVATTPPAWSPSGDLIAFADYEGRIRTITPDGMTARTVAEMPGVEFLDLEWSPGGHRLAFVARKKPPED